MEPEVAALASLKRIVIVSDSAEAADPLATDPRATRAVAWLDAARPPEALGPAVSPEMLAAIVYSSGTTGRPKGVMLSHRNVVSNVLSVLKRLRPSTEDVFLSFLPLSHTFERTAGYYLPIATGSAVAYALSRFRSLATICRRWCATNALTAMEVRNCARDEGRSLEAGRQGQASNHLKLLRSRAVVVSVAEKAGLDRVR